MTKRGNLILIFISLCFVVFIIFFFNIKNKLYNDSEILNSSNVSNSSIASISSEKSNSLTQGTQSEKLSASENSLNKKSLYQLLQNSSFSNYKDFEEVELNSSNTVLCRQVATNYNFYLISHSIKNNDLNNNNDVIFLIDDTQNKVSSGLFCYQNESGEFEIILLTFNNSRYINGSYLGVFTLDSKSNIDLFTKLQEFYQNRSKLIAKTFGVNLSQYINATAIYDTAYGDAGLATLSPALLKSLNGHSTENINNHPAYFVNKNFTEGIILNSEENGMQYYHRFKIDPNKSVLNRFTFLENRTKFTTPIKFPQELEK
jgi:hypothetical protein